MKAKHFLKLIAVTALALLTVACSGTQSSPTDSAQTTTSQTPGQPVTSTGTPAAPVEGPKIAQEWTLINFGAPW
jgi:ABC-type glycerol-3-phosphate transport system substrate-binding protein